MINWTHCRGEVRVAYVFFVLGGEPRNISDAKVAISYMSFCSLQIIGTAKGIDLREPFNQLLKHIA